MSICSGDVMPVDGDDSVLDMGDSTWSDGSVDMDDVCVCVGKRMDVSLLCVRVPTGCGSVVDVTALPPS